MIPDHEYGLPQTGRYVECPVCETTFQQPMPTGSELAAFYPATYHSMTHRGLLQRIRNALRIARVMRLAKPDGAILDFGCGDGSFLEQAAKKIPKRPLWGFEIAERAQTQRLSGGNVTIVKGDIGDLLAQLPACAVITMNHVIEHLPDPGKTIAALAERIVPGGVLEGQTPAAGSLEHAVFGKRWSGYHSPRHTVVFSQSGLRQLMEKSGLSEVKLDAAFNPAGIAVSLGSVGTAGAGRIRRSGMKWVALLGVAGMLAPLDLLSGRPGIVNFAATKKSVRDGQEN